MLPAITFLGHATVLVDLGGFRVLTDPVLLPRVVFLRRWPSGTTRLTTTASTSC